MKGERRSRKLPGPLDTIVAHPWSQYVLPTLSAMYFNATRVEEPEPPKNLPNADWADRERHALLARSEERLRGIEAKGPGLATVSAIIAAAVLLAVSNGWGESVTAGRVLLVLAVVFSVFSLMTPIYLVGQQRRHQLWTNDLEAAATKRDPEAWLAEQSADAAMKNTARTIRLGNLQDGARTETTIALAVLLIWVLVVPAFGVLDRTSARRVTPARSESRTRQPPTVRPAPPAVPTPRLEPASSRGKED